MKAEWIVEIRRPGKRLSYATPYGGRIGRTIASTQPRDESGEAPTEASPQQYQPDKVLEVVIR